MAATYTTVAVVSGALKNLLTEALAVVDPNDPPQVHLSNLKPVPGGQPPVLTLFLYEISEDVTMRNRPLARVLGTDAAGEPVYRVAKPPMPLVLRYLVTPWANDRVTEHLLIGRTLQTLYERQIRRGADLSPELATASVSVTLAPLNLEERTRVWWSIQEPYRLSLNYEVRVIDLDVSEDAGVAERPVRNRDLGAEAGAGE